jgi:hypothetical protein
MDTRTNDAPRTGGGWMGNNAQLVHFLRTVGADEDDQERLAVRGSVYSFLGLSGPADDVVVDADTQYRFHPRGEVHRGPFEQDCPSCRWAGLAHGLNGTSYGVHEVTVI